MKSFNSFITEAGLLPMQKKSDWISHVPRRHPRDLFDISFGEGGPASVKMLGKIEEFEVWMIDSGRDMIGDRSVEFYAWQPSKRRNVLWMNGEMVAHPKQRNATVHIEILEAINKSPLKAHDFYTFLIRKGFILVGHTHSPGGQKVWQSLAKHRDVTIHGWSKRNQPVNIDPLDPTQTHSAGPDSSMSRDERKQEADLEAMALVASKKIFPKRKRK